MLRKDVYFGERETKAVDVIVEAGYAETAAGAVRIALRQFAAAIQFHPPLVTPTTPAL